MLSQGAKLKPKTFVQAVSSKHCKQFLEIFGKEALDINTRDWLGRTALISSVDDFKEGDTTTLETVRHILSLGADISLASECTNGSRITALSCAFSTLMAAKKYSSDAKRIQIREQIFELLLEKARNYVFLKGKELIQNGESINVKTIENLVELVTGNHLTNFVPPITEKDLEKLTKEEVLIPVLKEFNKYQMDCRTALCMGDHPRLCKGEQKELGEKSALTFLFRDKDIGAFKDLLPLIFKFAEPKLYKEIESIETSKG